MTAKTLFGAGKKKSEAGRGGRASSLLFFANANLPYYFVLLCCLAFSLQLGILEPQLNYQKSAAVSHLGNASGAGRLWAFAEGGRLLVYLPHANATVSAFFEGSGAAETLHLRFSEPMLEVASISLGGKEVCAPCDRAEYPISPPQKGNLGFAVETKEAVWAQREQGLVKSAFFQEDAATHAMAPLKMSVGGGWRATPNQSMPSSFYGVDAPFHISRVEVLSQHIAAMRLPWADYSFLSAFPASLLELSFGLTHQYAYKVYHILLFFAPVVIFHFFSQKLKFGGRGAFLLSSLLYLAMPMRGYLTGGAADLFLYGMTSHTLATYLSLLCFYFAYAYVWEKRGLAAPVLLFLLSVLSNQRIVFPFAAMFLVMAAAALASKKLRRCALLAAACAASVAWFLLPQLSLQSFASYSRLGGIGQGTLLEALAGFFQMGHLILPLFFAAGMWGAYGKKEAFAVLLGFWGVACFLIATDAGLNAALPALDGMRLLPSFALAAFFISGIGARELFFAGAAFSERLRGRLKQDRETFAVCVALALLLPFSVLYLSGVVMVWDQLGAEATPLSVASEYESLSHAEMLANGSRIAFLWRSEVSQYPVQDKLVGRMPISYFNSTPSLAQEMLRRGESLVVFGNEEAVYRPSNQSKWLQYAALKSDPAFEELPLEGSLPVFRLKSAPAQGIAWGDGVEVRQASGGQDWVSAAGSCSLAYCNLSIAGWELPGYSTCQASFGGCEAELDHEGRLFRLGGIPAGDFAVYVSPQRQPVHYYALAASLAALAACAYAARKI